jgi:predicted CDP-diglyceride synthetase/phosphatidate cytidylyltransferase
MCVFAELNPTVVYILIAGFSFLSLVTLFVAWMKRRRPENLTFVKVWQILGGWWIINLLLGIACLAGSQGLTILFSIVSLLAILTVAILAIPLLKSAVAPAILMKAILLVICIGCVVTVIRRLVHITTNLSRPTEST